MLETAGERRAIEAVILAVENELEGNFESEAESRHVGELVMRHLRELDDVAYVRFASVYRRLKDVTISSRSFAHVGRSEKNGVTAAAACGFTMRRQYRERKRPC